MLKMSIFTLALAALALAALPVFADDEPAKPLNEAGPEAPPVAIPTYAISQLAPKDDEHPKGWSPVTTAGVIPKTAPSVGSLLALARISKLDLEAFHASGRAFQGKDNAAAALVLVGLDVQPKGFADALKQTAEKHGWQVRTLGSPLRLAVAWGSSEEAATQLLDWQTNLATQRLCVIVHESLTEAITSQDREAFMASMNMLKGVSTMQPKSGAFLYLRGLSMEVLRRQDQALEFFRQSIKPDLPAPALPAWQASAAGRVGHELLVQDDADLLEEEAAALELAVRLNKHAENDMSRFGNHYNLACTYARLDRLDEAFRELEASLKFAQEKLGEAYADQYAHAKDRDSDMDPLREDPRFKALMEKYAPAEGA